MFNTDALGNTYFSAGIAAGSYPITTTTPTHVLVAGAGGIISRVAVSQLITTTQSSSPVTSVFGRTGHIMPSRDDYSSSFVKEGSNLYFTNARSRAAISLTTVGSTGPATYDSVTGIINVPQYQNDFNGVNSFNTRTGAVTLTALDVTTALTYTPIAIETDPVWTAQKSLYYTKVESDAAFAAIGHTHTFASLTSKPTTLSGYGITDAATSTQGSNADTAFGWGDHGLSAQDKTDIGNLSGTNTGDQDLSSYLTSYTETDTLGTVIGRGNSTTGAISFTGTGANTGIMFNSTVVANDGFGIRVNGTSNAGEMEFYSTDDDDEPFVFRHYTSGQDGTGTSVEWFRIGAGGNITSTGTITASNFSGTSSGTNTGDQTNISGNAATATNVAWTGVTSRPTALSQFTNDLGNYGGFLTSLPSHNHDDRYYTESESDSRFVNTSGDTMSGRLTLSSISGVSQTVPNDYGAYLHLGSWGVGRTDASVVLVNTAYRADYATDLFNMNISRFTNDSAYITSSGRAYPRNASGGDINFYWSGQSGQPTWLWGGTDGTNMYVYNPSNFSVNYAASAGSVAWTNVSGRPTALSQFTNDLGIGGAAVTIQDSPPAGTAGKLWWESDTGKLKVYYGSAWVDATPVPDMSLYYSKAGGSINGDVTVRQTLTVVGNTLIQGVLTETSDISLKENILPLENSLDKVMKLNGVSFNKKATPNMKEVGFIAQEVEAIIPDLVTETGEGIKTVSYSRVTAVLVETIKEQQAQINALTDMVNSLTKKLDDL